MHIPQLPGSSRVFTACLILSIAVVVFFLPTAAARIKLGNARTVQDSPFSPTATFVVNDNGDAADSNIGNGICDTSAAAGDQCTLRAAIQEANSVFGNDAITFGLPPSSTITLNTALPDITGNLTITGPGSTQLTVMRSTAGGTPDFRIFFVNNVTTNFSGMTVSNGRTPVGLSGATSGGQGGNGGGILSFGSMTLTDMVISGNFTGNGGNATDPGTTFGGPAGFGGGISSTGSLTMTNVTVSNNTTGNGGNGGYGHTGGRGGGIQATGTLTMTQCAVTGNNTGVGGAGSNAGASGGNGGDGAGVYAETGTFNMTNIIVSGNNTGDGGGESGTGGHAGGIFVSGTATLTNSTVNNNTTGDGSPGFVGQGGLGGGMFNNGALTVKGSTINGNSTGTSGPNGGGNAGGIYNAATLTMVNSTISGNSTTSIGGGLSVGGTVTLTNVTITNNRSDSDNNGWGPGGGIYAFSGTITLKNTIVAGNFRGSSPSTIADDIEAPINSASSFNLIGTGGSGGLTDGVNNNQVGVANALLGPLANNGGLTQTHALLSGSTASDAGSNVLVTNPPFDGPPFTDQRGAGFNRIVDGPDANTTATVDIGAYETQSTFPDLADTSGNEDTTVVVAFEVSDSGSITSVTATSSNITLVPNNSANLNVTGSGSNRIVTINPAANLSGTSDITVTVNRTGGSTSKTFTVTINPVNDAPSFTKGADQSVNENSGPQTVSNWATNISTGPADESGQTVVFPIGYSNPSLFAVAPAVSPSGTLTYTPAAGASGTSSITLVIQDNGGTSNGGQDMSAQQTFNINVLEGGSLQFSSSSYSVNEATPNVVITVSRFNGSAGEARIDYSTTDGSAITGSDYTATSGTLIFPQGVMTQTFSVPILQDLLDETTEVIGLHLTNAAGSGSLGVPADSQLLIIDDDPTPSLRINDVSVSEGASGTVNAIFTVTLSAASSFTVTANYATADGSATAGSDYQSATGQVILNPGEVTKTISVTVNGDTTPEVNETFFVNLSNPTNSFLADSQGLGTILSDDAAGGRIKFSSPDYGANEFGSYYIVIVERKGDSSAAVTVDISTLDLNTSVLPCSTVNNLASARCDFTQLSGTLKFAPGEIGKSFTLLINRDSYVEGPETFRIVLSNPTGGAVFEEAGATVFSTFTIGDVPDNPNPIDRADPFVRQNYHDFLNRDADQSGLDFWTNQITSCGTDAACIELKRINVSAAFYLSIEFQETGYLVERMYKVAYGTALGTSTLGGSHQFPVPVVRLNEFLPDTQELGQGVIVGLTGWEQVLENNKKSFCDKFVQRSRFTAANAFPPTLTESQFVDKLNTNAGGVLLPNERLQLINELSTGAKTRAQVVRTIAEDSDLASAEKNRAFVLMQYFGYLRRNPNDSPDTNHTGYDFWLTKLNQFGGNFVNAEMVKAFITSSEYRQRFGQ